MVQIPHGDTSRLAGNFRGWVASWSLGAAGFPSAQIGLNGLNRRRWEHSDCQIWLRA